MDIKFHSEKIDIFVDNLMIGIIRENKNKNIIIKLIQPYYLKNHSPEEETEKFTTYKFDGPRIPFDTIHDHLNTVTDVVDEKEYVYYCYPTGKKNKDAIIQGNNQGAPGMEVGELQTTITGWFVTLWKPYRLGVLYPILQENEHDNVYRFDFYPWEALQTIEKQKEISQ